MTEIAEDPITAARNSIHRAGVERHGALWLSANQVAAEYTMGTDVGRASDFKIVVPRIVLRVLDRVRISSGWTWDNNSKEWIKTDESID